MNDRHVQIFEALKPIAEIRPAVSRSRHVSAIVYRDKILAMGFNKLKTHPFQKKYGRHEDSIFIHSEIHAIHQVIKQYGDDILEKCSLYVCRMKYENGKKQAMLQGMSKPCDGCLGCIAEFGIKNVYFTCDEEGYEQL